MNRKMQIHTEESNEGAPYYETPPGNQTKQNKTTQKQNKKLLYLIIMIRFTS